MARQIIKQPNGKYCIFSSIVDNVTHHNMSVDDIIQELSNESKKEIEQNVKDIINKIEKGEKAYYQFTISYEEILNIIDRK